MANHVRVTKSLEETLSVLIAERDRLDEHIGTLQQMIEEQTTSQKKRGETGGEVREGNGRKSKWSEERRKKHSEAMKKRWENRKKKTAKKSSE